MPFLGRSELRSACYSMALHFVPTDLNVELVNTCLYSKRFKTPLKPIFSTVFMDLDSYLNPKGCLVSTSFTIDKTRQKTPPQY
jgi:hypothetical protein